MSDPAMPFWRRIRAWWHWVAGFVFAGTVWAVSADDDAADRRLAAAVLVVALAAWYAAFGYRALQHDSVRAGAVYFAGAVPIYAAAELLSTNASFVLFILIPQAFAMFGSLAVSIAVVALLHTATLLVALREDGYSRAALVDVGGSLLVSFGFSVLLGAFIVGIIRESQRRADLIAELEATRAQLAAERHEAGVRAERERLSTEIHDTLAQGLASILMLSQAARAALPGDPGAATGQLTVIEQAARENLAEARSLVAALAPADLRTGSLEQALRRLADRHTRDTGVPVAVTVTGEPAADRPDTAVVLLRAAQEALTNVRRHANARRASVELRHDPGTTMLTVTDDGDGFDPVAQTEGYGLAGMRTRVATSGGVLGVRSTPGAGTTVRIELPEELP